MLNVTTRDPVKLATYDHPVSNFLYALAVFVADERLNVTEMQGPADSLCDVVRCCDNTHWVGFKQLAKTRKKPSGQWSWDAIGSNMPCILARSSSVCCSCTTVCACIRWLLAVTVLLAPISKTTLIRLVNSGQHDSVPTPHRHWIFGRFVPPTALGRPRVQCCGQLPSWGWAAGCL